MKARAALLRLLVWGCLSVTLWSLARVPTGRVLRDLTAAVARLCSTQALVKGAPGGASRGLQDDQIGLRLAGPPARRGRIRRYVMSLMRWHVNLIVLPPLAMSLGALTLPRRLVIVAIGLPLLLVLDAAAAFSYLELGSRRVAGHFLICETFHRSLEHGIAVVGVKILPVAVWGGLFLMMRRRPSPAGATGPARG